MWVRWPLQPLQTQLQPLFGQSVASPCHPWFTTTNLSYRFPIFETSATALCGTTGILLCRYVYTSLPCLDRISQWQQRLRYKLLFLLLVLSSVCVSSEQVTALRTWAIAYEKPHTTFTDEVLLHELHIYIYIHATRIHIVFFASGHCQPPAQGAGG